jgi:hypothetical protein
MVEFASTSDLIGGARGLPGTLFDMRIFRRGTGPEQTAPDEGDLATIVLQGEDMMERLADAHRTWGLGSAERWDLDQVSGLITWTFPEKKATAPAQIIASYNPRVGSWRWAWANDSILPNMRRESEAVRDWAEASGHTNLAAPEMAATDEVANTLSAICVRVTKATGFYRGGGASMPIITFGPVTISPNDGSPSTFTIDIEG